MDRLLKDSLETLVAIEGEVERRQAMHPDKSAAQIKKQIYDEHPGLLEEALASERRLKRLLSGRR